MIQISNPFPNKPLFSCVCIISLRNAVGKGEIAHNEQFLLFPQCFLPICKPFNFFIELITAVCKLSKFWKILRLVVWERVNNSSVKIIWYIMGKGENAIVDCRCANS